VLVALKACFLFSLSAFVQQRASTTAPGRSGGIAGLERLMLALLTNPVWVVGAAVNFAGFLLQAVALHEGSVSLVQPVMPTQLLFALLFAATRARHWPTVRDWAASVAIGAGIVLVLATAHAHQGSPVAPVSRVVAVSVGAALAIALLLLLAHGRKPAIAATLTATAAGCCFATTSIFLKLVADRVADEGLSSLAGHPAFWAMLVTTTLGTVLTQAALAAGPLPWAVAAMTVTNPVVGYASACVAFSAVPPAPVISALSALLLIVGAIGLATSRSATRWTPVQLATSA
jgi:hypothetical protein